MPNKEGLAMPKGPRFRASRLATACLALSASIAIAGCSVTKHGDATAICKHLATGETYEAKARIHAGTSEYKLYAWEFVDGNGLPRSITADESDDWSCISDTDGNPKGGDATQAPSDSLTAGAKGIADTPNSMHARGK